MLRIGEAVRWLTSLSIEISIISLGIRELRPFKKEIAMKKLLIIFAVSLLVAPSAYAEGELEAQLLDREKVTVFNFVRAETDLTLDRYVRQGALGKLFHMRQPTPIEKQDVIRMNRDTLYSFGIFDLTHPVTIIKPDPGKRFQSMLIINQDHSMLPVEHGAGTFTFTREKIGTRYVLIVFRTFADAGDPKDVKAANALQDQIKFKQADSGSFEIPNWDEESLLRVRKHLNALAADITDFKGFFGDKSKLDPIKHLLGTSFGWGGNPEEGAMYDNVVPEYNNGIIPYRLTVKDVPVDGFWSVTVYNAKGFMEPNDLEVYSYNNVTTTPNDDGSFTINFGGDPKQKNYMPITPGWNYAVRMYQPRAEIIDGRWTFPRPVPVK